MKKEGRRTKKMRRRRKRRKKQKTLKCALRVINKHLNWGCLNSK